MNAKKNNVNRDRINTADNNLNNRPAPENYDIIFTGQLLGNKTKQQAEKALKNIFKKDDDFVKKLFAKSPFILKKNTPKQNAIQIQSVFARAGLECIIKPSVLNKNTSNINQENITVEQARNILHKSLLTEGEEIKTTARALVNFELFIRISVAMLSSLLIFGLFSAPKRIIGYIAEKIEINGQKLDFDNRLALFVPSVIIFAGSYLYILITGLICKAFYTVFLKGIIISAAVFFYPVIPGIAFLISVNMTIQGTTLNGFAIGTALFDNNPVSIYNYINKDYKKVYFYGLLMISSLFGFAPVLISYFFKEWFGSFQIQGRKYLIKMPWDIVILGSIFNFLTLGIYIFKLIPDIHLRLHQNSYWADSNQT